MVQLPATTVHNLNLKLTEESDNPAGRLCTDVAKAIASYSKKKGIGGIGPSPDCSQFAEKVKEYFSDCRKANQNTKLRKITKRAAAYAARIADAIAAASKFGEMIEIKREREKSNSAFNAAHSIYVTVCKGGSSPVNIFEAINSPLIGEIPSLVSQISVSNAEILGCMLNSGARAVDIDCSEINKSKPHPKKAGRYKLLLGAGGLTKVRLARNVATGEVLALRKLHRELKYLNTSTIRIVRNVADRKSGNLAMRQLSFDIGDNKHLRKVAADNGVGDFESFRASGLKDSYAFCPVASCDVEKLANALGRLNVDGSFIVDPDRFKNSLFMLALGGILSAEQKCGYKIQYSQAKYAKLSALEKELDRVLLAEKVSVKSLGTICQDLYLHNLFSGFSDSWSSAAAAKIRSLENRINQLPRERLSGQARICGLQPDSGDCSNLYRNYMVSRQKKVQPHYRESKLPRVVRALLLPEDERDSNYYNGFKEAIDTLIEQSALGAAQFVVESMMKTVHWYHNVGPTGWGCAHNDLKPDNFLFEARQLKSGGYEFQIYAGDIDSTTSVDAEPYKMPAAPSFQPKSDEKVHYKVTTAEQVDNYALGKSLAYVLGSLIPEDVDDDDLLDYKEDIWKDFSYPLLYEGAAIGNHVVPAPAPLGENVKAYLLLGVFLQAADKMPTKLDPLSIPVDSAIALYNKFSPLSDYFDKNVRVKY